MSRLKRKRLWEIEIKVFLKEGIHDPEGRTILETLKKDFSVLRLVRAHVFTLTVRAKGKKEALRTGKEMASDILANPVMEEVEVRVVR